MNFKPFIVLRDYAWATYKYWTCDDYNDVLTNGVAACSGFCLALVSPIVLPCHLLVKDKAKVKAYINKYGYNNLQHYK